LRPLGDVDGEPPEVRSAVAGADDVLVERLVRLGHRRGRRERAAAVARGDAEVPDERAHHPLGRRPRAVGRADRLDDILEDGRAADHPARPGRGPRELGIRRDADVEPGEVFVEAQHVPHDREQALGRRVGRDAQAAAAAGGDPQRLRAPPVQERHRQRGAIRVDLHRRQLDEPV
jgi:hypothetical protein